MCDSVLGLKWALGWDSKSSGQRWVWCLGPTCPDLWPSVQGTYFALCSPVPSLFSQTVWGLFLWCSTWRWSNRDRQNTRGKKGRFPEGCVSPGWIQFLRGFFHLCFILFPMIALTILAHTPIPWSFYSVCRVPMSLLSHLSLIVGTIVSTPLLSISATLWSHCLSVSKSL